MLKVRLFRPFSIAAFLARAAARRVRAIAVLDRTKEPGAVGEPLYLDVVTALAEARADGSPPSRRAARRRRPLRPVVEGVHAGHGEGGLRRTGSRPARRNHFTVGIVDDVTHTSLAYDAAFDIEPDDVARALFYGLGAGRHGRRQQELDQDHRRGDRPLRAGLLRLRLEEVRRDHGLAPALRPAADPLGLPDRATRGSSPATSSSSSSEIDVLEHAARGAVFLLNAPGPGRQVWERLPREVQEQIVEKQLRFYVIDAYAVAQRDRHGRPHQHDHADLLLRDLRRPAARGGDRADQAGDREDLREARRGGRAAQLRGGRRDARAPARGAGARRRSRATRGRPPMVVRAGARLRAARHRGDAGRQGRSAAGERLPGRRHLAARHGALGEAQHRAGDPGLGRRRSASSATSARWSARTRRSAPRSTTRRALPGAPADVQVRAATRGSSSRRGRTRSRSRPKTAPAATCA